MPANKSFIFNNAAVTISLIAQRVILWNKVFQRAHREQALGEGVDAAHHFSE
jgi:hypothetical protein